jgi:hypothetical protein
MAQNIIVKGTDKPVNIVFNFTEEFATNGLNEFSRITLQIGDEAYDTAVNTNQLVIVSSTELSLRISDSTALSVGRYPLTILGYNATFDDGFPLTSDCNPMLGYVKVCE